MDANRARAYLILGVIALLTLITVLMPCVEADSVRIREIDEEYTKKISREEVTTYSWEISNTNELVKYSVNVELGEGKEDWGEDISEELFDLKPNSTKKVSLTVSCSSRFDGAMKKHKVIFKFTSDDENFTINRFANTTQDIPEAEKDFIFVGIKIPLFSFMNNMAGKFTLSFVLWVLTAFLATFLLQVVLARLTKKTDTKIDDEILTVIQTPLLLLIILFGTVESLVYLELSPGSISRIDAVYDFGKLLISIWLTFRLFQIGLAFIGEKWGRKEGLQIQSVLIPLIDKLGKAIIFIVFIALLLDFFGIDITVFVAGAGIAGLVIAFAAQDTLANFFAGIFLITEPKFKVNDTIGYDNDIYIVRKIGLRTTQLYDLIQNIDVIVPNQSLATSKLVNMNEPDEKLRIRIDVPVAYGTDVETLEKMFDEVAGGHPEIITDVPLNPPELFFDNFGESSMNFYFIFWIRDLEERFRVRHNVLKDIYYRLRNANIEIPRPHRIIMFKDGNNPLIPGTSIKKQADPGSFDGGKVSGKGGRSARAKNVGNNRSNNKENNRRKKIGR